MCKLRQKVIYMQNETDNLINSGVLRTANDSDAEKIHCIETALIDCPWSKLDIINAIKDENYIFVVYESENQICGYGSIRVTPPECELNNIAVSKEFQGCGIAKQIMTYLISAASEQKCDKMFLEVEANNQNAINLYEKLDFKIISKRKNYYGESCDALIYCKGVISKT